MAERVDYDTVANVYSNRYEQSDYAGVGQALAVFVSSTRDAPLSRVLEVGCGTGHWLRFLRNAGVIVHGIDSSSGMLSVARATVPDARLTQGRAEALPLQPLSFDRILCINALHHFTEPSAFFREARRVIRPAGGVLIVGLDPHTRRDRWWIYEYFPEALVVDRKRYPSADAIRGMMASAGFERCTTQEVQNLPRRLPLSEASRRGFLERKHTSQLMVISDDEYQAGLARIRTAGSSSPHELVLEADLTLYGTIGWLAT
jgi:SAM-dependent methyltransferase